MKKKIEIFEDKIKVSLSDLGFMQKPQKDCKKFKVLLVYPNLPLMLVPPLSIAIFTSVLKNLGYELSLFETTAYLQEDISVSPENRVKLGQAREFDYERDLGVKIINTNMYDDFKVHVKEFNPSAMIFSVVEDSFDQCRRLIESVADINIPHLVGGVFPTAAPERCLQEEVIKVIALGEGEKTIEEYCESIRTNENLSIRGTWLKKADGSIIKNDRQPLINIGKVMPDFSLFDSRRFYRPMGGKIFKTIPIETYRGCPYRCTFCNSPMQVDQSREEGLGSFLRRKSMPRVREEIFSLIDKYAPEFLYFVDDSFLARPPSEIKEFCKMYSEFKIPFWFNTRPENCGSEELELLKNAGAYRISFGIECGNEEYRKKVLLRNVKNQQIIESFERIKNSGIPFSVKLIVGFPGETRELVLDTVELVKRISGYDTLTVSIFTPYHGTRLREVAVKNGWLKEDVITKHTTSSSILDMPKPYLNRSEINGLMRTLPFYCYFSEEVYPKICLAESDTEAGNEMYAELLEIYQSEFLKDDQAAKQSIRIMAGSGCKASEKDSYFITPSRLTEVQLISLHS